MANGTNTIANPAPLGLLGFGMTTLLLNLHNASIIPLSIVIVAMGFALGGAAQIIAGIMEFKKNNVFGATAFTAYGFFWWSLIIIWPIPSALLQQLMRRAWAFICSPGVSLPEECSLEHSPVTDPYR
jgi:succinate-acetate transporter protein